MQVMYLFCVANNAHIILVKQKLILYTVAIAILASGQRLRRVTRGFEN